MLQVTESKYFLSIRNTDGIIIKIQIIIIIIIVIIIEVASKEDTSEECGIGQVFVSKPRSAGEVVFNALYSINISLNLA